MKKTKKIFCLLITLVMVFGLLPATAVPAFAASRILFVSESGDDNSGNGSLEQPYATIEKAYEIAEDGDTIGLQGDMKLSSPINLSKSVTLASYTFEGEPYDFFKPWSITWEEGFTGILLSVQSGTVNFTNITVGVGGGDVDDRQTGIIDVEVQSGASANFIGGTLVNNLNVQTGGSAMIEPLTVRNLRLEDNVTDVTMKFGPRNGVNAYPAMTITYGLNSYVKLADTSVPYTMAGIGLYPGFGNDWFKDGDMLFDGTDAGFSDDQIRELVKNAVYVDSNQFSHDRRINMIIYDGHVKIGIPHTITVAANPTAGGSATAPWGGGGVKTEEYAGLWVNLSASANIGYEFSGWTSNDNVKFSDATAGNTKFYMPNKEVAVTANFVPLPPAITSADSTSVTSGLGGIFQVTATGGGITYSLVDAPTGVGINSSTGVMTVADTVAAGSYDFIVKASNGKPEEDDTQSFTLTVNAASGPPNITSAATANITSGEGGTHRVKATGGGIITYSLVNAPTGVSIDSSTGIITVDQTVPVKIYNFTVKASNNEGEKTQDFWLFVEAGSVVLVVEPDGAGRPKVSPAKANAGDIVTLTANPNAGYKFSAWSNSNNVIPLENLSDASTTFTMPSGSTKVYITAIYIALPTITSADNASVTSGSVSTFQVTSTGDGTITYTLTGAPTGVSIDSSTGLITVAGTVAAGSYPFTVTASNGKPEEDATQAFTLAVNEPSGPPEFTSFPSTSVTSGEGGTYQVSVTGGGTITYSLAGAPTGVSIDASTGVITVADTVAAGNYPFTVKASNNEGEDTQDFLLSVVQGSVLFFVNPEGSGSPKASPAKAAAGEIVTLTANPNVGYKFMMWSSAVIPPADMYKASTAFAMPSNSAVPIIVFYTALPKITSTDSASVTSGSGGTFQVTATTGSGTIMYSLTGAPAGVSINSSTGLITVAETVDAGSYPFTVTASNGTPEEDATQSFTLNVKAASAPNITSANSTSVTSGSGGTFQVIATGSGTITYTLNGAPAGVSINPSTGLITVAGTVGAGSYPFTVTASNGTPTDDATQSFTLTVNAASGGGTHPAPGFGTPPTAGPGTQSGTTKVTGVTAGSGNELKVLVTSGSTSKPNVGDTVPSGASSYTAGNDISGVDATTNKYVAVYEVDGNGKIVKFSEIVLSSGDIKSGSSSGGSAPAPILSADDSDNDTNHSIELTFTDDSAWRGAITEIRVGGIALSTTDYTITSGKITIHADVLNGGTHTITVMATGYVYASVIQSVNLPGKPANPQSLVAAGGNGYVTLTWSAVSGVTDYRVYVSETPHTFDEENFETVTGAMTHQVQNLTNGTKYYFVVKAVSGSDSSAASNEAEAVPSTVPGMPTGTTAVAGNGQATISFTPPANNGGSPITKYIVTSQPDGITAEGTTGSITVTGLTNGTAYTFTVVAVNSAGDSPASAPTTSVTPTGTAGAPSAPLNVIAVAGNGEATISFAPPANTGGSEITGYKVISQPGGITVSGTKSPITITGLSNGTVYTFSVIATNSVGDSPASASSISVTPTAPAGSPGAPTNVTAVAGNGQATISFTSPADNGGNPITEYKVTSQPGGITATGTKSPITITGLTNGTSYTFTVQAINSAGSSAASAASSAVVPRTSGSTGGDTGSNSGNSGANGGATSPSGNANEEAVIVLVNGKEENAGKATTGKRNEQTLLTIAVDQKKLDDKLAAEGQGAVVTIPVKTKSDVIIGELNGQMVKNMENKEAVLVLQTDHATYTIPAHEINIDAIFAQLGKPSNLTDIKVRIEISASQAETIQLAENAAAKGTFSLVMPPLEFNITAVYGNQTVSVTKFNAYVERTVAIPDGIDPNKITTGVVIETDGSVRHVPTQVTKNGARYFAKINSLTNSTYAVVWNPIEFSDVAKHWAKSAVNDMGSRMVIDGTGGGKFTPNRDITRAEFAAILVRGLGLKPESGATSFSDVKASDWYSGVINTAYAYRLIDGFEDGTFRPNDKITREQAMLILSKAMILTGLTDTLSVPSAEEVLSPYGDASKVAKWAQNGVAGSVQAGIVTGRSADTLAPKANMTRAEVAAIIQRMLQKSELIEVK